MKIYTKTGDSGETGLVGGTRVRKNNPRIEAIGAVDELNAALGIVLAGTIPKRFLATLRKVQSDLFALGADLATPVESKSVQEHIQQKHIERLEEVIDKTEESLPVLQNFILPGGCPNGAALHFARVLCRRAERSVITLSDTEQIHQNITIYLNRLSDLLFTLARAVNQEAGSVETAWHAEPID